MRKAGKLENWGWRIMSGGRGEDVVYLELTNSGREEGFYEEGWKAGIGGCWNYAERPGVIIWSAGASDARHNFYPRGQAQRGPA